MSKITTVSQRELIYPDVVDYVPSSYKILRIPVNGNQAITLDNSNKISEFSLPNDIYQPKQVKIHFKVNAPAVNNNTTIYSRIDYFPWIKNGEFSTNAFNLMESKETSKYNKFMAPLYLDVNDKQKSGEVMVESRSRTGVSTKSAALGINTASQDKTSFNDQLRFARVSKNTYSLVDIDFTSIDTGLTLHKGQAYESEKSIKLSEVFYDSFFQFNRDMYIENSRLTISWEKSENCLQFITYNSDVSPNLETHLTAAGVYGQNITITDVYLEVYIQQDELLRKKALQYASELRLLTVPVVRKVQTDFTARPSNTANFTIPTNVKNSRLLKMYSAMNRIRTNEDVFNSSLFGDNNFSRISLQVDGKDLFRLTKKEFFQYIKNKFTNNNFKNTSDWIFNGVIPFYFDMSQSNPNEGQFDMELKGIPFGINNQINVLIEFENEGDFSDVASQFDSWFVISTPIYYKGGLFSNTGADI